MLSQVTRLLALVSAPPLEATTIVHVEVLLLEPELVMVVLITSAGGVTKRTFHFEAPVDSGLAKWANEYLNEEVAGLQLGTALLRRRFDDPGLSASERAFLTALRPAFIDLVSAEQRLYVGGAADLLGEVRAEELEAYRNLFELGETTTEPRQPFVRVGHDLEHPALHEIALVGACYGLVHRALGAVSLIGPVRMDYEKALGALRGDRALAFRRVGLRRPLTSAQRWQRQSAITTSSSASTGTRPRRTSRRRSVRSPASCIPTSPRRPTPRSASARWSRRTRCCRSPRRASCTTGTGMPVCAAAASSRAASTSAACPTSSRRSSATICSAAPPAAPTSPRPSRSSSWRRPRGRRARSRSRSRSPVRTAAATAPSLGRRSRRAPRAAAPGGWSRSRAASSASSYGRKPVRPAAGRAG